MTDLTAAIVAYETDGLNDVDTLHLFAELIRTGLAWQLQGHYGRTARDLIAADLINPDGSLTESGEDLAELFDGGS